MSKTAYSTESDQHGVILPTLIPNLRLQVFAVKIRATGHHTEGSIEFRGKLRFPGSNSAGVRELYRSCDVEGHFSSYAWDQMIAFHDRLFVANGQHTSPVELVAGRTTLELPRASVTETELGFAAVAVLRVVVNDVECARIPGHRWRYYSSEPDHVNDPTRSYGPNATMRLH